MIIRDRAAVAGASIEDLNETYRKLKDPNFKGFGSRAAAELQVDILLSKKNPFKEGTLSAKLHDEIAQQKPIEKAGPNKRSVNRVMATFTGESKPQEGSLRNQVLLYIQQCPNHMASLEQLEAHFKQRVRGQVSKLIEKRHLVALEDDIN